MFKNALIHLYVTQLVGKFLSWQPRNHRGTIGATGVISPKLLFHVDHTTATFRHVEHAAEVNHYLMIHKL